MKNEIITVGELVSRLSKFDQDAELMFGGTEDALRFERLKRRGDKLVQVVFDVNVYRAPSGELMFDDVPEEERLGSK